MDAVTRYVRARCAEIVDRLPLPLPFTMGRFLHVLGQRRGKRIELVPAALGASVPCGLLIGTDEIDYIIHPAHTSRLHARHIVLHEIGHLELGHLGTRIIPAAPPSCAAGRAAGTAEPLVALAGLQHLLPDLSPELIRHLFTRTRYQAVEEREAELFAGLAAARITSESGIPSRPAAEVDMVRLRLVFGSSTASRDPRG